MPGPSENAPTPPELAGIATYASAARVGYSVDENVRRLLRLHWVERRLMAILIAHLPSTPDWEIKCALALHQWYAAEQVDALRRRIAEMRNPLPPLDTPPDASLHAFLEELLRARDTVELVTGIYGVAIPALAEAYRQHAERTNPLVDHPTRRLMRQALVDRQETMRWGDAAVASLTSSPDAAQRASSWRRHLAVYLEAAGGIAGDAERPPSELPAPRADQPFAADTRPRRDARFSGQYDFDFPPHLVYNAPGVPADERNLALLCKRTLEMDVPEMMASFLIERANEPWEFYRDYSRQLWDEARHAMMGTVALAARGIDWTALPLNVGFALRLNLHATPIERQILLWAIEQSLMPSDTGKRFEYHTAVEAGDALSAHFHDYDWADEVLHAQIGRRMLRRDGLTAESAMAQAQAIHDRTWAALEQYRRGEPRVEWWGDFVRTALGKESAIRPEQLGELKIFAE